MCIKNIDINQTSTTCSASHNNYSQRGYYKNMYYITLEYI